jgi:hypothetical protein
MGFFHSLSVHLPFFFAVAFYGLLHVVVGSDISGGGGRGAWGGGGEIYIDNLHTIGMQHMIRRHPAKLVGRKGNQYEETKEKVFGISGFIFWGALFTPNQAISHGSTWCVPEVYTR